MIQGTWDIIFLHGVVQWSKPLAIKTRSSGENDCKSGETKCCDTTEACRNDATENVCCNER